MSDFAHRNGTKLASVSLPGRASKRTVLPNELSIRKSADDDQKQRFYEGSPATPWEADHFDKVRSFRRQKAFEMPDTPMPDPPVLPGDA